MPSGYQVNGTDLDSIFKVSNGANSISAEYKVGGSSSYGRYASSLGTGDRSSTTTNYKINGNDLKNLYRRADFVAVTVSLNYTSFTSYLYGGQTSTGLGIVAATAANGTGNYSYSWTFQGIVSGYNIPSFSLVSGSENSSNPGFLFSNGVQGFSSTGRFRVTVTDTNTGETATADFDWTVDVQ